MYFRPLLLLLLCLAAVPAVAQDMPLSRILIEGEGWKLVDEHINIGGVRIEDSVHVTDSAPENLTGAISKAL